MYVKSLTATLQQVLLDGVDVNYHVTSDIINQLWSKIWEHADFLMTFILHASGWAQYAKKFYLLTLTLTLPSKFFYIKNSTISCGLWNKNLKLYARQSLRDIAINFT